MNHIWTVVCERSITDIESNNISLIHVIEQIKFREVPADKVPPGEPTRIGASRFEVVSLWGRGNPNEPETADAKIIFCSPTGQELAQNKMNIDLTEYKRIRTRWMFFGLLPYSGDGEYTFVVQQEVDGEWRTEAEVPLEISKMSPED